LALAVAVLWTVHPLQTESVTYVIQRAESMMGLFYLLTLYCFIRKAISSSPGGWYMLSITACLLGMASREVMMSAPLIVLLYDRTFVSGSFAEAWRRRWRVYVALAATWIPLGCLVVAAGYRGGSAWFNAGVSWQEYALTQAQAIPHYLRLCFWPHPLVFDYGTTLTHSVTEVAPEVCLVAALLVGTLVALYRWPAWGFLSTWFFAILAPTSSVIPVATQTVAEHRMYLSLAAVVTAVVIGAFVLGKRLLGAWPNLARFAARGIVVVVLWLGTLTIWRNPDYGSELKIWYDTLAKRPDNPRAHLNLGNTLNESGNVSEAMAQFVEALRIKPDYAEAHITLGSALSQAGRLLEAIQQYEQALRINPDYAEAHSNLGVIFQRLGNLPEAVAQYEQALRVKPDYVEAHYNLGLALEKLGRTQGAAQHYQAALNLRPDFTAARNALARLRAGQ